MRDPKATKKIQKMLKVIKSANKSVLAEAVDTENTAVTRTGSEQPDQDDYGYESQEAAALYKKMMEKYSKLPDEEKFPASKGKITKKDLEGTRERMKAALQREDEPQPRQRKSKSHQSLEKEVSPPPEPEKKPEKTKFRKPAPPPLDFNQLLKLAEKKKDEPIELPSAMKKMEQEPERPMTKRQKREYEEEQARKEARRRRMLEQEAAASSSGRSDKPRCEQKKTESTFTRIPKIGDKINPTSKITKNLELSKRTATDDIKQKDCDKQSHGKNIKHESQKNDRKIELKSQNTYRIDKSTSGKAPVKMIKEGDKFKSGRDERGRPVIEEKKKPSRPDDRGPDNINRPQPPLDRSKLVKEQDRSKISNKDNYKTARIENKDRKREDTKQNGYSNTSSIQNKPLQKHDPSRKLESKDKVIAKEKMLFGSGSPKSNGIHCKYPSKPSEQKSKDIPKQSKSVPGTKSAISNNGKPNIAKVENRSFDFDKHVNSLKKGPIRGNMPSSSGRSSTGDLRKKFPAADPRNRNPQKRRIVHSDSEYDSEMEDFIDDGDDEANYSEAIRDIFGYDRNKYRDLDDDDDGAMESSFAQQMREEYISKKCGILEDLEDMRMEAMEKKKSKKRRRISDDDD